MRRVHKYLLWQVEAKSNQLVAQYKYNSQGCSTARMIKFRMVQRRCDYANKAISAGINPWTIERAQWWWNHFPTSSPSYSSFPTTKTQQLQKCSICFGMGCWLSYWENDLWLTNRLKEQVYHFCHQYHTLTDR